MQDNLAITYQNLGQFQKAEQLLKNALAVREKILGEKHPSISFSFNNLAVLYQGIGRVEEAELLYKKSLEVIESVYGKNSRQSANTINNLSLFYYEQSLLAKSKYPYVLDKKLLS